MEAASYNGVANLPYSQNIQNDNNCDGIQERLFKRVATILAEKGIRVEGTGALSIDMREDGSVKVIGDIRNREQIEKALTGDSEILGILKQGSSILNSQKNIANCKVPEDEVSISSEATAAYEESNNFVVSENDAARVVCGKGGGLDKGLAFIKMLDLPAETCDLTSIDGLNNIKNALNNRIKANKEEVVTRTEEILLQSGIVLGEDEEITLSVDATGEILVEPAGESDAEIKRANKISEALNKDKGLQEELAGKLTTLDLDERSLASIGKFDVFGVLTRGVSVVDDKLLADLAENKYGENISELQESGEELVDNDFVYHVLQGLDAEGIDNSTNDNTTVKTAGYKISNSKIISANSDDIVNEIWKPFTAHVNDLLTSGKIVYEPDNPSALNFKSFVAEVSSDGKVEVIEAKDREGKDLDKNEIAGLFMKCDAHNKSSELESIVSQTLQQHDYEHNDVDEYEHKVRITGDINTSMKYEIISPEADKAATKELKENMEEINTELTDVLKGKGVITPVEIKVNEYGRLEADTSNLSGNEQDIVDTVLKDINKELDKPEKETEEDDKKDKVEQEEKSEAEVEKEINNKKKELEERREGAKSLELRKLGKKSAELDGVDYVKEAKNSDEVVAALEKKVVNETGVKLDKALDAEELEKKSEEVGEVEDGAKLPSSLKGFEKVVELAKGLEGILAKFHERDNLLAAIA